MPNLDTNLVSRQVVQHAEQISRLRHDVDRLASEITDAYADLVSRVEAVATAEDNSSAFPTAWNWRTLGPKASEELWKQLSDWVTWIRHRYPLAKKIPRCWGQHPEVVEELTALWVAWQAAYEKHDGFLTAAADWHDRWLPGVLHRLEHGSFALDCAMHHQERPAGVYASATEP
ncbi:MAG: hypothetical protein JWR52_1158 [Marmoricola sp.]|nr:hypothetical protein [Marmoricola sp.]